MEEVDDDLDPANDISYGKSSNGHEVNYMFYLHWENIMMDNKQAMISALIIIYLIFK
jgi:hypothetical protein